ncbi:MAG: aminotransferase class I/II-fold pyridoxal phosphate-dependent enzyme [candidate division NC10 bacterium]|nr:aminotransferase class I/II-fold pyridoxal phosphate-dependent enzyme [candidate division NC10 bacterium]
MELFDKCRRFTTARRLMAAGWYMYFEPIESAQEPEVVVNGRRMVMIGSNNYLGLTTHPKVQEAACQAIKRYGTGCGGSRFLNGNLELHEAVEHKLAQFKRKEAALLFSTGFQTNLGILSTLGGKGDVLITDRLDHASIVDGCRLAFSKTLRFRHNDMADLERILVETGRRGKLVVVDGIFSMEGDIAKLAEIVRLTRKYGGRVMVDDAHATGVLGKEGRGSAEHFGLEEEVDLIMGTCSKALASVGGFVAGRADVIHYLRHRARSLMFSASLPASCAATIGAALDVIVSEPERRERLWENARRMKAELTSLGFDTGLSETPIIPVVLGEDRLTFEFAKGLREEGIFANPAVSPAVPKGRGLIRTSYMATHTPVHLDRVLSAFRKVGKRFGVI